MISGAAALLGVALTIGAGPTLVRARARAGTRIGPPVRRPRPSRSAVEPLAVAASLDVLAVCLAAGMAVSSAAAAAALSAPPPVARVLQRAADLLALGADPAVAWSPQPGLSGGWGAPQTDALLRLARRSATSGAALADGVAELATRCREEAAHEAAAAAERAGVLIAGPLGVCFLPAFICLGIVPVVAGLADKVLGSGLL